MTDSCVLLAGATLLVLFPPSRCGSYLESTVASFGKELRSWADYALVHGVFFVATHNGKVAVFGVKMYAAISLMVFLSLAW